MLTRHRAATVDRDFAHPGGGASVEPRPLATTAQHAVAPLCIVAAGAAFLAEMVVRHHATTFVALAVVPVLAASLLRSRPLALVVAAFSMLLQGWGVEAGRIRRDAAGMQVFVYLLTLAVAALQQSRSLPASSTLPVTGVEFLTEAATGALPTRVASALTPREREVALLAARGFTAREIGSHLFISERTVETHLGNTYGKLGVRSKVELARLVTARADLRTGTEALDRATA